METVEEAQRQVAQGGQCLRSVSGADGGGIFPEEGILGAVQAVFDAPVAAVIAEQLAGRGLGFAQAGDEAYLLDRRFAGAFVDSRPGNASPLFKSRPADMADRRYVDAADVDAPVADDGFLMRLYDFFPPPLSGSQLSGRVGCLLPAEHNAHSPARWCRINGGRRIGHRR